MSDDSFSHVHGRLARRMTPDVWLGLVVGLVPPQSQEQAGAIVHTPEHFLGALWAPLAGGPARWPEAVVIGSPTSDRALAQLFRHMPTDAKLFLAGRDDVDAALAAEILLASDRNLETYQKEAIGQFIAAERTRTREAIEARYTDRDEGFERFLERGAKGR